MVGIGPDSDLLNVIDPTLDLTVRHLVVLLDVPIRVGHDLLYIYSWVKQYRH